MRQANVGHCRESHPLSAQTTHRRFDEETVLRAAGVLEAAAQFTATPAFLAG
jgi:aspartyl-tRNA(Asn)/glutamyl-tRNA(Gln) amidotransferase subunit A